MRERKIFVSLALSLLLNIALVTWITMESTQSNSRSLVFPHQTESRTDISSSSCALTSSLRNTSISVLQGFANTIKTIIPPSNQLDHHFKNPCWFMYLSVSQKTQRFLQKTKTSSLSDEEASAIVSSVFQPTPEKSLVCIPQVYFIGFPRSGSTQLYKMLTQHPEIKGGINKEPHWWTKSQYTSKFPHDVINIVRYLSHFTSSSQYVKENPKSLLIDGSQSTIWHTRNTGNLCFLPQLMSDIVPEAKYIVLMRNPIERLYSDFCYLCEAFWKSKGIQEIPNGFWENATELFHQNVMKEMKELKTCLKVESLEKCTHHSLTNNEVPTGCGRVRLGVSLYHVHINRWLKEIPKKHFLFLRTDELASDPLGVLDEVWSFLDVAKQSETELQGLYEHLHSTKHQGAGGGGGHVGWNSIGARTEVVLRKFFQPYNNALVKLLEDDGFNWT